MSSALAITSISHYAQMLNNFINSIGHVQQLAHVQEILAAHVKNKNPKISN